jgi:hypothetical protein
MEQLRKVDHARNTPIIVPNKVIDLKKEHEMIVELKFNHTLLQDKLMSCKYYKHIPFCSVPFFLPRLLTHYVTICTHFSNNTYSPVYTPHAFKQVNTFYTEYSYELLLYSTSI